MSRPSVSTLFSDPTTWQVFASGQAEGRISTVAGADGTSGLQLDYDFHGGGGFVVIRRVVRFTMPETFEIGFQMRGKGPRNHFEFKVADPGGSNVWRNLRQHFELPSSWTEYRFNERNLPFAWGPAGGGPPAEIEAVEFVIAAGPGGKGVLQLSYPTFEDQTLRSPRRISASSEQAGCPAEAAFAAGSLAVWKAALDDSRPWWCIDFGRRLRFGGLVINWPESLPPRTFEVEASDDGSSWTSLYRAQSAQGAKSHLSTPGAESQLLRITFANSACAALGSLTIRPDAYSRTPNQFLHNVAADLPRGWFPRYWLREQSYWTPVGSPDGKRRALFNEEGAVEVDEAGFSLEPFVLSGPKGITWADVETIGSLPDGGLPVPSVTWKTEDIQLEILPWVDGEGDELSLHVTYRLESLEPVADTRLIVAVRPFHPHAGRGRSRPDFRRHGVGPSAGKDHARSHVLDAVLRRCSRAGRARERRGARRLATVAPSRALASSGVRHRGLRLFPDGSRTHPHQSRRSGHPARSSTLHAFVGPRLRDHGRGTRQSRSALRAA
jgi:GNAT superfamily N-acetyltransferase